MAIGYCVDHFSRGYCSSLLVCEIIVLMEKVKI